VLVARDGQVVFQGGFGLADIENKTPITTETKFRIGSVSKQFTAVAVLKLVEQGRLALDDSLAKFFPDFPGGDRVTVRQLLTHTSGLKSYTDKPEFIGRVSEHIAPEELIGWFRNDPPDFEPGAGFHYNNSAYFLLGEIVAKVSGQSLADYLSDALFEPLGMQATGVYVNASPPEGMARGYSYDSDTEGLTPALDWDMSWAGGAGALYSTVGDLFLWNEALYGGKLLSEDSFKAATTPVVLPPDVDGLNYGFGLMITRVHRLPMIGHGGGLSGWASDLLRLPEQRCTVVVLGNSQPAPPQLEPSAIAQTIVQVYLKDEIQKIPPPEEDKSVDPKSFSDYIGRYEYKGAILTVTVEEDALFAQLTGQPKHQIFPKSKDAFFWKVVDAEVQFLRDDTMQVVAARHSQNGNTFRAAKLDETVTLTEEQAERYVGKYQYGPATMTVTRDGTQLFAQITGQPKFPIFPKSETEFEWRVVEASVTFEVGEDGAVTKAVHSQNGITFDAPKVE
jgi:CubicO group peptidase (beta-lactamase class C family)